MIVKDIARAKPVVGKTVGVEGARRAKTRAIVGLLQYVTASSLGVERDPKGAVKRNDDEQSADERAYERALAEYLTREKPAADGRVGEIAASWSDDEEVDAEAFLERALLSMADVDPSHFRHVVLSERHADLDLVIKNRGAHGRERPWGKGATVSQVADALRDAYGCKAGIMVVEHVDAGHRHFHAVVVTVDPLTGKGYQTNRGFDHEVLHMVAARLDHETNASSEPNALFVADERGIYDRWSGLNVAGTRIEIDAKANQQARRERTTLMRANDALEHVPGWHRRIEECFDLEQDLPPPPAWDDERVAILLARSRITAATSWHDLHRSLAMVGITYEPAGGGARLSLGDESTIKATAAASTASLAELERRLGRFEPIDDPALVRKFVRPTYTLDQSREFYRANEAASRRELEEESFRLRRKRNAAAAAIEAEEELDERVRLEALARLDKVVEAARDELRPQRKHGPTRPASKPLPSWEAIAWQRSVNRATAMIEMRSHYDRRVAFGAVFWSQDGRDHLVETRRQLSIARYADKRQALRLAFSKFGEDFEMICGTRGDLDEYTRIAAADGIMFGDTAQRARIKTLCAADEKKRRDADERTLLTIRADRARDRRAELDRLTSATYDAWQGHLAGIEREQAKHEAQATKPFPYGGPVSRGKVTPRDRRALLVFQKAEPAVRAHLILRDHRPIGTTNPALIEAFREFPHDLHAPLLRARLFAESLRQDAERDIMLYWLSTGLVKVDSHDDVEVAPRVDWFVQAYERERRNPAFLNMLSSRARPADVGDEPALAALAQAMVTGDQDIDMAIVRSDLAWVVRQRLRGRALDAALARFDRSVRARVRDAVGQALKRRPTTVVDETLMANRRREQYPRP